jgi:hypothetical protein
MADTFSMPTLGEAVSGAGSALGSFGTAVGDLYSAQGAKAEQDALNRAAGLAGEASSLSTQAAGIAGQNISIEEASTALQVYQQQRALTTALGTQKAQVGAAGFAESGSALDLLASSRAQGAIQRDVLIAQGAISENAFREQQLGYETQSKAYLGQQATDLAQAKAAGIAAKNDQGAAFGNILKGAITIGALFI